MDTKELIDLVKSWLAISLAFSILLSGGITFDLTGFAPVFLASLLVVGTGFIFHELAHRQVARRFGAHAEFRAWNTGLIIAVVSAFFGFLFAAPGAVYIYSQNLTKRENGLISIAGAAANILLAIIFLAGFYASNSPMLMMIAAFGAYINFLLAAFNLLPIFFLDGIKVFSWSPLIWGAAFFSAVAGFIYTQTFIMSAVPAA